MVAQCAVETYERVAGDPHEPYGAGTVLRVKWPLVDGRSEWFTAIIAAVSDRTPPRRKRATPSHFRYTLLWSDNTPALATRLLHLPFKVIHNAKAARGLNCERRFITSTAGSHRHELPCGVYYERLKNGCERLRVQKAEMGPKNGHRFQAFAFSRFPDVEAAVRVASLKRLEELLGLHHQVKKARKAAAKGSEGCA